MAPKSIWRRPGTQHFQLVHRSQRDPLIHDPEASTHVLKGFERENLVRKGKTRADLEQTLPYAKSERANIGEAAEHGVYFDDTDYDYMQHLRPIGMTADAILLEAPNKSKGKEKTKDIVTLPGESLPSQKELSLAAARDAMQSVPSELVGFNPDLDQHLRQTLEALDDDAFVGNNDRSGEEDLDDLFGELLVGGEREAGEAGEWDEWEFREEGIEQHTVSAKMEGSEHAEDDLVSRVAAFKKAQALALDESQEDELEDSEGGDTIGKLPSLPRYQSLEGGGEGKVLVAMHQVLMEILYNSDEDMQDSDRDNETSLSKDLTEDDSDEAPELLDTREDLGLVGNKMRPVLGGITPAEKLAALRHALVDDINGDGGVLARAIIKKGKTPETDQDDLIPEPYDIDAGYEQERWDCETILCKRETYSNVENHPRLILARDKRPVPRIQLHPKTGLPSITGDKDQRDVSSVHGAAHPGTTAREEVLGQAAGELDHFISSNPPPQKKKAPKTISRPRNESKEDKKARKEATRNQKQASS
ncbi:Low temperature viability protein [Rhizoctonia solani]|uniref:Low temperature viability protein n=1 Tax=Rhizoctonia solani TaxID=456999 RepID=A0A8H7IEM4_9AGAM|nr:Low temperature viability protein [Rhizoctonia solani]